MSDIQSQLKTYRLSQQEYEKIKSLLGREPVGVEWAVFSALWSEHCSYKSSKVHLKKFYNSNSRVLQAEGENAGVVDLGEGEKVAFKMESHNHPSFISPHQGAATGVGGILRDIFTMGARPVALANYLCFGKPNAKRMSHLVDKVVAGIADYGNCVGVPMLTGQTNFHSSYDGNILVNAFALGYYGPEDPICVSGAKGVGNFVVYVGAKTGRDGIHGASMASESFNEGDDSKKPTIQIGDPFYEKLLIESCLEVMKLGLVEAIQDMGAAGLTSSSFEMSAKGGLGFDIDLGKVPLRDPSMTPEDVLLSESQERMLLICKPENFQSLKKVFLHWGLDAEKIGVVTAHPEVKLSWGDELLTQLHPSKIVDHAPLYKREYANWRSPLQSECKSWLQNDQGIKENLLKVLGSIQAGDKSWIFQQYDQRVGTRTAADCSQPFGAFKLDHSDRMVGVALGCRPYIMRFCAQLGGRDSVLHPALHMSAKGFMPVALTDCLNFGNPEKPEVMSEFVAAVEAISEVCRELDAPVISGNVSFYNETDGKNVTSTPSTGLVGLKDGLKVLPSMFQCEGNKVFLLSLPMVTLSGAASEVVGGGSVGFGQLDLSAMKSFLKMLRSLSRKNGVVSTRATGQMGLAYQLARMSLNGVGIQIKDSKWKEQSAQGWLEERLYEVIVEVKPEIVSGLLEFFETQKIKGFEVGLLGETQLNKLTFNDKVEISVSELKKAYQTSWEKHFETLA